MPPTMSRGYGAGSRSTAPRPRIAEHGAARPDMTACHDGEPPMTRLHARSNAEAHLYMDLHPCACGAVEFDRQSSVISDGGALCSRYAGPCRRCGTPRVFAFELPEMIRPVRGDQIEFGGTDP